MLTIYLLSQYNISSFYLPYGHHQHLFSIIPIMKFRASVYCSRIIEYNSEQLEHICDGWQTSPDFMTREFCVQVSLSLSLSIYLSLSVYNIYIYIYLYNLFYLCLYLFLNLSPCFHSNSFSLPFYWFLYKVFSCFFQPTALFRPIWLSGTNTPSWMC